MKRDRVTLLALGGGVKDEAMLQLLLKDATDIDSLVALQPGLNV